ncbi:hypothetical protein [Caulobacter sp. 17J65-9]|uniref:hypothetical protein n=1 Tax=Caulobacter sp. 17J65-9 TaxID=2709382 RepID=UPI0013CA0E20|nr:hypothetical protein [Caulobacter sp. 17J65-9]NEX95165.1 hypothetical protein [Caulobacter sp. 17J65-9]
MKTLLAASAATIALASAGSAAHAQEQTVESAQRFLSRVVPGAGYWAGWMDTALDTARQKTFEATGANPYVQPSGQGVIREFAPAGECKQQVGLDFSGVQMTITMNGQTQTVPFGVSPMTKVVNWADLGEARVAGGGVVLSWRNGSSSETRLGSESMAARVAYAMEFLRLHCDTTGEGVW